MSDRPVTPEQRNVENMKEFPPYLLPDAPLGWENATPVADCDLPPETREAFEKFEDFSDDAWDFPADVNAAQETKPA